MYGTFQFRGSIIYCHFYKQNKFNCFKPEIKETYYIDIKQFHNEDLRWHHLHMLKKMLLNTSLEVIDNNSNA